MLAEIENNVYSAITIMYPKHNIRRAVSLVIPILG